MVDDSSLLTDAQKATIDNVYDFYSKFNSQQLSDLTHMEAPWGKAREGLSSGGRGNQVIGLDQLATYYSSIAKHG